MANEHTAFWLALLDQGQDLDQRARLWNGYLGWKLPQIEKGKPQRGWPNLIVNPPDGGWPALTREEREILDTVAEEHGGHPEIFMEPYMAFSEHTFSGSLDFSGLILLRSNFNNVQFEGIVDFSDTTQVYGPCLFREAIFERGIYCSQTRFNGPVSFAKARFKEDTFFLGVDFADTASFTDVGFEKNVEFDGSQFEGKHFPQFMDVPRLADFRNAEFMAEASFSKIFVGNDHSSSSLLGLRPERMADFSGAKFIARTDFSEAVFSSVPAFFNTTLHEDTDFSGIDWRKTETETISVEYAIRAWERLELIMSKLEKPLDRHRFFRLKMRTRRRTDKCFLRVVNWLFETVADYGWGVRRAFSWWLGHWLVASLILLANTCSGTATVPWWKLSLAAVGTGFSNAHAFLFLTSSGGYLEKGRKVVENNDAWGLLTVGVGAAEAVLGPIFLFLLLLTLRNRFRLA